MNLRAKLSFISETLHNHPMPLGVVTATENANMADAVSKW